MNKNATHLFFIYEPEHIPLVEARLAAGEEFEVVALDYEIELDLKKKNIAFSPLRELARSPEGEREPIEYTRRLANEWYTLPELKFFEHEGILLGEPHAGALHQYFGALVYYLVLVKQLLALPGITGVSVPESFLTVPPTADPTAVFKERLPADVVRLLASQKNIDYVVIPAPVTRRAGSRFFVLRQKLFHAGTRLMVGALNALVTLSQKPRPIKLLSTDPWSRIEPFVSQMDDVEIVMTRRQEIRLMRGAIWRTRARFHHRLDFADREVRALARLKVQTFKHAWDEIGDTPAIAALCEWEGVSFWPIAREVLGALVTDDAEDAIATIESAKVLMERRSINCVLLFSSVKGYNNLLARLAERMNIPSIELQHATEVTEASHPYARLNSRYLLAYGGLTKKTYLGFGVEPWRIVEAGSPRFDAYARSLPGETLNFWRKQLGLSEHRTTALVLLPSIHLSLEPGSFTSYSTQETFETYGRLHHKLPAVRFLLRPRPGPWREEFYRRQETLGLFSKEALLVHEKPMQVLLALSDFVITGNSTVVLEAMLMHRPVLLYLPRLIDEEFKAFEDAGAVVVARTEKELYEQAVSLSNAEYRVALVERADTFLQENFLFNGHSAERVAALIRRVAKKDNKVD